MLAYVFLAQGWKALTVYEDGANLPHDLSWQLLKIIRIQRGDQGADDALISLETCGLYLEPTNA